jgi:hypothetical protein
VALVGFYYIYVLFCMFNLYIKRWDFNEVFVLSYDLVFLCSRFEVIYGSSFSWYLWNCCPSLFKLFSHKSGIWIDLLVKVCLPKNTFVDWYNLLFERSVTCDTHLHPILHLRCASDSSIQSIYCLYHLYPGVANKYWITISNP